MGASERVAAAAAAREARVADMGEAPTLFCKNASCGPVYEPAVKLRSFSRIFNQFAKLRRLRAS